MVMDSTNIKALAFDVFGTVVDWRGSLIREGMELGRKKGIVNVDWGQFADAWRKGYRPAMDRVRSGEKPWENIDTLHQQKTSYSLPTLINPLSKDQWQSLHIDMPLVGRSS